MSASDRRLKFSENIPKQETQIIIMWGMAFFLVLSMNLKAKAK
jgi:hypothetical protein